MCSMGWQAVWDDFGPVAICHDKMPVKDTCVRVELFLIFGCFSLAVFIINDFHPSVMSRCGVDLYSIYTGTGYGVRRTLHV